MHFRTKRRAQSKFDIKFNGNSLEYCKEYKYLGVWINEDLDLNLMLERVSLASRRALACLIAKAKEIGGFHYNTFYHLYHTLVAPVMDYSSCIWGYRCQSNIEIIPNSALRFYLSAGKHHPICALQGDMGWLSSTHRHYYEILKWWIKIRSYENCRIAKQVFI